MIKIEIKNRFTGKVIFEYEKENNTISETVKEYIRQEIEVHKKHCADLRSANLRSADLRSADLRSADLHSADLRSADLRSADLRGVDLRSANLRSANLRSANLRSADLRSADLRGANLRGANLRSADLRGVYLRSADLHSADLRSADLRGVDLLYFKSDLWRILLMGKNEIEGLVGSLKNGKVDGTVYEGDCACLKGTIANVAGCKIEQIDWMKKDTSEPAEQWFLMIKKGDTPETSNVVKQTLEWIEEFKMFLNR